MKVEIYQLITDIYSAQAMISKLTRSFEGIVSGGEFTPREDHMLEVFPSTGGFLILVEDLLVSHPRYYELMNKLVSMGRNFLSFIEIAAGAIDPVAFDQELDFQSATAAVDCFDKFLQGFFESQIAAESHTENPTGAPNNFGNNLIVHIENITASMTEINLALKQRRQLGRSICFNNTTTLPPIIEEILGPF
jgi:hypothetical protein